MEGRPYRSLLSQASLLLLITLSDISEVQIKFSDIEVKIRFSDIVKAAKLRPSDCKPKCTYRCSATSHKKPCMFFCLKCCSKCLCVPPGTYGNKQVCPCCNNWKTKEGGPKCP